MRTLSHAIITYSPVWCELRCASLQMAEKITQLVSIINSLTSCFSTLVRSTVSAGLASSRGLAERLSLPCPALPGPALVWALELQCLRMRCA